MLICYNNHRFFFVLCFNFNELLLVKVGTFVQRLLFGNTGDTNDVPIAFTPNVKQLRDQFKQKYGYRGKYLIEQLGNGRFRYSSGYMPCISCPHKN